MSTRAGEGRGDGSPALSEPLLPRSTDPTRDGFHRGATPTNRVGAHNQMTSPARQHSMPLGTAPRDVRAVARRGFRPLRGAWLVLVAWAGVCVATLWALLTDERGLIGPFDDAHAARASLNAALLLASGALELTLRHVLKRRQRQGYLAFYRGVRKLIPQPFRIVSLGTAVLFVIVTTGWSVEAARAVATLQCAGMVGCLLAIGEQIRRHNTRAPSPDARVALGGEDAYDAGMGVGGSWGEFGDVGAHGDTELGLGDDAHETHSDAGAGFVSEEQAEFNRYLCDQVRELGRECVRLRARLAEGGKGSDSDCDDDVVSDGAVGLNTPTHRSTSTHRRGRGGGGAGDTFALDAALSAARSELTKTHAELEERKGEITKLVAANRQHEFESTRLRASLEEWSSTASRLERRLEQAERAGR